MLTAAEYRELHTGKPQAARKAAKAPAAPPAPPAAHTGEDLPSGRNAPKEQPRPPGHRRRYAVAQGGGLPYAGCRVVFDDVTPQDAEALRALAAARGIGAY